MRYCVIRDTVKIIDGSDNPTYVMLQNAINAGFSESEIEILTEEEYQQRLENEPKPQQEPTKQELLEERINELELFILTKEGLI